MAYLGLKEPLPVALPLGSSSYPFLVTLTPKGRRRVCLASEDPLGSQRGRPRFEGSTRAALSADHLSPGPSLTQLAQQTMCELWMEGLFPDWVVAES